LLTDRWDLSAADVVQLYLWRWQIELFFRWMKSHVHLPRVLGYSRNAVELTVWLAIIVHLLTLLAMRSLDLARRVPGLLRKLGRLLSQLTPSDLQEPTPVAQQLAFPGWDPAPAAPT
jgi:IS4 transposase